jgi:regulator of RNase E activity RraA
MTEDSVLPEHCGTAQVADACLRLGIAVRSGPTGMRPLKVGMRCAGRVLPLQYDGAPERFFQVLEGAALGDVLILDNEGRLDESCMGDVMAWELRHAGLGGLVIWGLHRDSEALMQMEWPIFSLGTHACANTRDSADTDISSSARCGAAVVSADDFAICDCDGIIFVHTKELSHIADMAVTIAEREAKLMSSLESGTTLRRQLAYDQFVVHRKNNPSLTFRDHLKRMSGTDGDAN